MKKGLAVRAGTVDPELAKDMEEAFAFMTGKKKKLTRFTTTTYKPLEAQDVKEVRETLHLSQSRFAVLVNTSVSTVQAWEQGSRRPDGIASLLLTMLLRNPGETARMATDAHKVLRGNKDPALAR
jgi:putative transcriptional regulator